jgi:SAM-dependent methyltransferase
MRDLSDPRAFGVEFGAGAGATKVFFPNANILLTDIVDSEWLDLTEVNAEDCKFPNESFDYVVVNNVLHHLPHPMKFLLEAHRVLKPGGRLYIQEYHTSLLGRFVLKITNHESFDASTNSLSETAALSSETDPWDANCDVARQIFDNQREFEQAFPGFKVELNRVTETLVFLNSGGVVVSAPHVKLGKLGYKLLFRIDQALNTIAPNVFGLQRQIILKKA